MPSRVLFLCTGNYYRSRFAESYFNHLAAGRGLGWEADSRALAIERGACNVGPISPFARAALADRGVGLPDPCRFPAGCLEADLAAADLVVALKEAEHRPYMLQKFPRWVDRITYWHVHDLDAATPDEAMAAIELLVTELVERLAREARASA
ncbi:MAG TPA: low molecular weight phosphatase family protein [Humisphaera sp.]